MVFTVVVVITAHIVLELEVDLGARGFKVDQAHEVAFLVCLSSFVCLHMSWMSATTLFGGDQNRQDQDQGALLNRERIKE